MLGGMGAHRAQHVLLQQKFARSLIRREREQQGKCNAANAPMEIARESDHGTSPFGHVMPSKGFILHHS